MSHVYSGGGGPPQRIRTSDLSLRRAALYPTELGADVLRLVFTNLKFAFYNKLHKLKYSIFHLTFSLGGGRYIHLTKRPQISCVLRGVNYNGIWFFISSNN